MGEGAKRVTTVMGIFSFQLKGQHRDSVRGLAYLLRRCSNSLFLLTLFSLSACSWELPSLPSLPSLPKLPSFSFDSDGTDKRSSESCDDEIINRAKDLEWKQAKIIDLNIRKGNFAPSILVMTAGMPNIVRIFNRDEDVRAFRAEAFFKNTVLAVIFYDGREVPDTCINAIRIGPKKWAELHLVPLNAGDFPIGDDTPAAYSREPARKSGKIIVR